MKNDKPTPGPWKWERFKSGDKWQCILRSTRPASECYAHDTMIIPMREDCAAFHYAGTLPNHKLLEAAPDLLEACEKLLTGNQDKGSSWEIDIEDIRRVMAAIEKAKGNLDTYEWQAVKKITDRQAS